jgi:hypothetical protein
MNRKGEYVELVHMSLRDLSIYAKGSPRFRDLVVCVKKLFSIGEVHYVEGELDADLPQVPKDTPIRVGGSVLEFCVKNRAKVLRDSGYENVTIDRDISLSAYDI